MCLFNSTDYSLAAITINSLQYPYHFLGAPIDSTKVTQKMEEVFPGFILCDLPSVTAEGRFFIPTPPIIRSLCRLHPPSLVVRLHQLVTDPMHKSLLAA